MPFRDSKSTGEVVSGTYVGASDDGGALVRAGGAQGVQRNDTAKIIRVKREKLEGAVNAQPGDSVQITSMPVDVPQEVKKKRRVSTV